jgi:hypothetical protein
VASAHELYAHSAVARSAGLPDQVVRELAAGQMPGELSAAEQARPPVRYCLRSPAARRRPVSSISPTVSRTG